MPKLLGSGEVIHGFWCIRGGEALQADFALTGQSVVEALRAVGQARKLPKAITVDSGAESTSKALDEWCYLSGVQLDFIRPGKPTENGVIESFNGRLRVLEGWKDDYNLNRPHGSLGHLTPSEFAKQRQRQGEEATKL